jgi:hypothetical protein
VSAPDPSPFAQPEGAPPARRWPLAAALLVTVALVHALALMGLVAAGGGTPAIAGQAPPARGATMAVRTVPAPSEPVVAPVAAPQEPPADRPRPQPTRPDAPVATGEPFVASGPPSATPGATAAALPAAAATEPGSTPPPGSPEPRLVAAATPPAAAAPAAPSAPPLPRYRASLPPPFEARFDMRRGAFGGQADWRFSNVGGRYQLELQTSVLGQNISHLRSEGGMGRAGLEPVRFVDGRRGRDRRAVIFQRDAPGGARISFSGPAHELPLPEGVQDRLSWLLQLAAIVDTDPALRQPGARVSMWVVSPRGDADVWVFEITGAESLRGDDGRPQPALALQRKADRQLDTEVRVWLDPAAHHLPLRAAWRHDGEGPVVELRRLELAWR